MQDQRMCPECNSLNTKGFVEYTQWEYYELDNKGNKSENKSDMKNRIFQNRTGCCCLDCGYSEYDEND